MKRLVLQLAYWYLALPLRRQRARIFPSCAFGFCRIWWNNGINPIGTGWTRIAIAPDFSGAWAAQDSAAKKGKCK